MATLEKKPKTFHQWASETFGWIDTDAKRLMQRAWTACNKEKNKQIKKLQKRVDDLENDKVLTKMATRDDILDLVKSGAVLEDFENYFKD